MRGKPCRLHRGCHGLYLGPCAAGFDESIVEFQARLSLISSAMIQSTTMLYVLPRGPRTGEVTMGRTRRKVLVGLCRAVAGGGVFSQLYTDRTNSASTVNDGSAHLDIFGDESYVTANGNQVKFMFNSRNKHSNTNAGRSFQIAPPSSPPPANLDPNHCDLYRSLPRT